VYKLWNEDPLTGDYYTIYKANYNPFSYYLNANALTDTFDLGNTPLIAQYAEPTTSNGQYQRVVHRSVDHLYYRDFYTNTKASFGGGNVNTQYRYLEDQAQVISLPQSMFGESVLPRSITITTTGSYGVNSGSYYTASVITAVTNSYTIVDDGYGNLIYSGAFYSPYGQYVGGAYTNYTSSVSKIVVGEWPFNDTYKYVNAGPITATSSYNGGAWQMQSFYKNVSVVNLTSSTYPYPSDLEMLGAIMHFTGSRNSHIRITPNINEDYRLRYNFENGNFSVSMMLRPTQKPVHASGSVILNKQGPVEALRIDDNGNLYTVQTTSRTPYRLVYTTGSCKLLFEREGGGNQKFTLTSSLSMSINELYNVVVTKSGSLVSLYVNGVGNSSLDSGSCTIPDPESSNLSDIYIGNDYTLYRGFSGQIDNVKFYKEALSQNDINILHHTLGVGNTYVGNAFYTHGMFVLTSIPTRFSSIQSVSARGTHTVFETEVACTVNPGEFGMSSNPTLQVYEPLRNEFVYRPFVTSSYFKPYVTSVGLYNDYGELLMIGKLNMPMQLPDNMDTTFIVRYDR
jgi:hypothetical protein